MWAHLILSGTTIGSFVCVFCFVFWFWFVILWLCLIMDECQPLKPRASLWTMFTGGVGSGSWFCDTRLAQWSVDICCIVHFLIIFFWLVALTLLWCLDATEPLEHLWFFFLSLFVFSLLSKGYTIPLWNGNIVLFIFQFLYYYYYYY